MREAVTFAVLGYLCGGILFARICARLFRRPGILTDSRDGNPGAANAFTYGGFWCGCITLLGDVGKGFFPVLVYLRLIRVEDTPPWLTALVIAAPVLGHTFPVFYRFRGGKGIAVTFGCLLALYPAVTPVALFALLFLFFSLVLRITPHFARTVITYLATLLGLLWLQAPAELALSFLFIAAAVLVRMYLGQEERERVKVRLLWMR